MSPIQGQQAVRNPIAVIPATSLEKQRSICAQPALPIQATLALRQNSLSLTTYSTIQQQISNIQKSTRKRRTGIARVTANLTSVTACVSRKGTSRLLPMTHYKIFVARWPLCSKSLACWLRHSTMKLADQGKLRSTSVSTLYSRLQTI